jgi:hypothetical protein
MQVMHMYNYCGILSRFRIQSETLARSEHSSGVANLEGKEERKIGFDTTIVVRMSMSMSMPSLFSKQQYQQDGCFHDKLSTTGDVVGVVPTTASIHEPSDSPHQGSIIKSLYTGGPNLCLCHFVAAERRD